MNIGEIVRELELVPLEEPRTPPPPEPRSPATRPDRTEEPATP